MPVSFGMWRDQLEAQASKAVTESEKRDLLAEVTVEDDRGNRSFIVYAFMLTTLMRDTALSGEELSCRKVVKHVSARSPIPPPSCPCYSINANGPNVTNHASVTGWAVMSGGVNRLSKRYIGCRETYAIKVACDVRGLCGVVMGPKRMTRREGKGEWEEAGRKEGEERAMANTLNLEFSVTKFMVGGWMPSWIGALGAEAEDVGRYYQKYSSAFLWTMVRW
ncbi:hypothetical protein BDQ17DRAFT_1326490 [Cyathus striatus]|nr:hypothetical protein BDQ17DRAFT_1326490 [Cyathus striatus]